jgi:hypothetical protein
LQRKAAFGKTDTIKGKKKRIREEEAGKNGGVDGDNGGNDSNREEVDGNNGDGDGRTKDNEQDSIVIDHVAKDALVERYKTMWS